jgi:FkbM family methyltransferase
MPLCVGFENLYLLKSNDEKITPRLGIHLKHNDYEYKIGKYSAILPQAHPLKIYQDAHPNYDRYFANWLDFIDKNPLVLDIGANIGDTALFICSSSKADVVSVEPSDTYFNYLQDNIKRCKLDDRVKIEKLALLPEFKSKSFTIIESRGTASTEFNTRKFNSKQSIESISIGEYLSHFEYSFDLIKSDTDGLDLFLMNDVMGHSKTTDTVLFFELDHNFYGKEWRKLFQKMLKRLESLNYSLIVVDNFGRVMMATDRDLLSIVQMFIWIENQKKLKFQSVYYLDIWAFPESQRKAYENIVRNERLN